jgi:hypothetical protein
MAVPGAPAPPPTEPVELALLEGAARLSLGLPADARPRAASSVDLSSAPGARLDLHQAWSYGQGAAIELVCVRGAADRWLPGLEDAVLGAASAMVRGHGGWSSLAPGEMKALGGHLEQSFRLQAGDSEARSGWGKHLLGFAGEPPELLLCSAVCSGAHPTAGELDCELAVASLSAEGLGAAPPPGMLAGAAGWVMQSPVLAGCVVGACALGALSLLLGLRPRPRW